MGVIRAANAPVVMNMKPTILINRQNIIQVLWVFAMGPYLNYIAHRLS